MVECEIHNGQRELLFLCISLTLWDIEKENGELLQISVLSIIISGHWQFYPSPT